MLPDMISQSVLGFVLRGSGLIQKNGQALVFSVRFILFVL
jgi:hypothetical protein